MRTLSKSKLLAFRQCPKRLWLEVHHPELREDSAATQASFVVGHQVGAIAQKMYDIEGNQQGRWSIKKVLPAVAPDLGDDKLESVQDGGLATKAYLEAIAKGTTGARKIRIEKQLLGSCWRTANLTPTRWSGSGNSSLAAII